MRCHRCGGSIVFDAGNSAYPARHYCLSCGRESGEKEMKDYPEKPCDQCRTLFKPKKRDSRFCSRLCSDKYFHNNKKLNQQMRNKHQNYKTNDRDIKVHEPNLSETITLPVEAIRAIKRSVGKEIITELMHFIEKRFA
jgi:predicted  nucleic acid-binding Zn-ribbon protein